MNRAERLTPDRRELAHRCPLGHRFSFLHMFCRLRHAALARVHSDESETASRIIGPSLRDDDIEALEAHFRAPDVASHEVQHLEGPSEAARARVVLAVSLIVPMWISLGLTLLPAVATEHALTALLRASGGILMLPVLGSAMLAWLGRLGAHSRAPMPWTPLLAAAMAAGITVLVLLARGTLAVDHPLALVLPLAALGVLVVFLRDWQLLRKAEVQA